MKRILASPSAQYRPLPFWSWNDQLCPEELCRQIREMHRQGCGGFFMHARGGLLTEYMSEQWMACVSACVREAQKLGMEPWLYDENGWPSGFGAGSVNGRGIDYQQKSLRYQRLTPQEATQSQEHTLAYFSVSGKFLGTEIPAQQNEEVWRFYYEVNPFYTDNLNPACADCFIHDIHQRYYDELPDDVRDGICGIFTDEPELTRNVIPWSFVLPGEYEREYGEQLLPQIYKLVFGGDEVAQFRIRFWRLIAKLFSRNFFKPIHDWCEEHGWKLTGHVLSEEDCQTQIASNGAVMPIYQYFQLPGLDHIIRRPTRPTAMTQLASAAAQNGQKEILSESFALCGWNFRFSDMQWMLQQEQAHGITRLCQHLFSYSLKGMRKRDCPGSWSYHQPWWNDYRHFTDSVSRVGMMLALGKQQVKTLVVHPLSTAWTLYDGPEVNAKIDYYSTAQETFTKYLDALHIPHHYADELSLEEDGSFVRGAEIFIGQCSYNLVILPPLTNLSATAVKLLREFRANGGKILVIRNRQRGDLFTIDGVQATVEECAWLASLPHFDSESATAAAVAELVPERIRTLENGQATTRLISTSRGYDASGPLGQGVMHFVVNLEPEQGCMAEIYLPASGKYVSVIDGETGVLSGIPGVRKDGAYLVFPYEFTPGQGAMFWVDDCPAEEAAINPAFLPVSSDDLVHIPVEEMRLAAAPDNILTLDRCRYRVDGGSWIADDVRVIQSRLLALGSKFKLDLEFTFKLDAEFELATPLYLVVEKPEECEFSLNGFSFKAVDQGYCFDQAFRKIPLPAKLQHGDNILRISMIWQQSPQIMEAVARACKFETECNKLYFDSEVESVYLTGQFQVKHDGQVEKLDRGAERYLGNFSLTKLDASTCRPGQNLLAAGFPFFAGTIGLRQEFNLDQVSQNKKYFLKIALAGYNSVTVKLNGHPCGWLDRPTGLLQVQSDILLEGKNLLEIEATTSLRNMLGPHHLQEGDSYAVGIFSFNKEKNILGFAAEPYNSGYCFVRYGIDNLELVSYEFAFDKLWKFMTISREELHSYRLSSLEEPTDEQLQAIMEQMAEAARQSTAKCEAEIYRRIEQIREKK